MKIKTETIVYANIEPQSFKSANESIDKIISSQTFRDYTIDHISLECDKSGKAYGHIQFSITKRIEL